MSRGSVWTVTLAMVFGLGLAATATAQQAGNGYPDSYDYGYDQNDSGYGSQAYRPFDYSNERQYREPQTNPYDRNANEYREPAQPQYVDPYDAGADPSQPPSDGDLGQTINRRTMVEVPNTTNQPPGTIVIDTASRHLYYTQPGGQALRYGIGVGRQGFAWKGVAKVQRKAQWPDWIPPSDMLKRRPDLPLRMSGGIENPLGARALYLFQGNRDTMFRIHGTNEPDSIGKAVSSGCIRMMNGDVIDLYNRVPVGTKVVVL